MRKPRGLTKSNNALKFKKKDESEGDKKLIRTYKSVQPKKWFLCIVKRNKTKYGNVSKYVQTVIITMTDFDSEYSVRL